MAPRRNNSVSLDGCSTILPDIQGLTLDPVVGTENHAGEPTITTCCVPTSECLRNKEPIFMNNTNDVVKVLCNNDHCPMSKYMHKECFEHWEQNILTYLKSCGRARSWSDKQRQQNLWTKKGYDLAFRACNCLCGRGFIRKDLDWSPMTTIATNGCHITASEADKKKKKRRQNNRPTIAMSAAFSNGNSYNMQINGGGGGINGTNGTMGNRQNIDNVLTPIELRARTVSISSSNGSNGSSSSPSTSSNSISPTLPLPGIIGSGKKKKKPDPFSALNGSGIFFRRKDFSAFNILPRHKLNSYHVKMEDEGNHGNDEIRSFVLSNLTAHHQCRVICVLCSGPMKVYDRYPLIDGTFFLSPMKHAKGSVEVAKDNRRLFLNSICMRCLEAFTPGSRIRCVHCKTAFDGGSMVIGTMYTYDVFAAMACCQERVRCSGCHAPLLLPHERLNYFSDYSRMIICPHCGTKDYHFVRPISNCYVLENPT
ncbi:headcase protein isoform X1 [Planococcus citri]|uniref:headcase protein isoform X1 n=1 Tax=Planococcus citri TaxID=170843 RepID=UPI0031F72C44